MDKSEAKPIVDEVMDEYEQTDVFQLQFIKFYENAIENNLGGRSLERLIENVNLPEDEQIDES